MVKGLPGPPARMSLAPGPTAREAAPVAQQKRQELLALSAQVLGRDLARSHQVTNRFMDRVRHPDGGQFAGAQQACQRDGITTIGLDAVAGAGGHERGGDHVTGMAERMDLPVQPVSGGASFVADVHLHILARQLADQAMGVEILDGDVPGVRLCPKRAQE